MATVQTLFIGLLVIVNDVAMQGLSPTFKDQSKRPHLTGCISREMESFYCSWSVGTFHNLTEPGDLRLFYMLQDSTSPKECPKYTLLRENECHFGKEHTHIWTAYKIQLCSRDQNIVYDEVQFTVENIVYPDPPVGMNWTILSVGMTKMYTDVVLSWEPPPSAANHVEVGWLALEYETQYRETSSATWTILNADKETKRFIYGLRTNTDYEIRVRCKTKESLNNFSNFSDTILINVPATESSAPVALGFFFTAVGFVIIGILVIITRQKKLMVIFLPPVPGPKIRGIDPELLKKGKLAELTAILTSHSVLRSDLYNDDSWVEFIELDIEKPNEGEQDLETAFLIDHSASSDSTHLANDFRDDDSGRASCCEQDLPDSDTVEFRTPVLSSSSSTLDPAATVQTEAQPQEVKTPSQESWPGTPDLYAQVRQVTLSGEVVLTPEEHSQREEAIKKQDKPKYDQPKKEPKFHLLVRDDSEKDTAFEPDTNNMTTSQSTGPHSPSISPVVDDVNGTSPQQLVGNREPQVAPAASPQSWGVQSAAPVSAPPEYTVVDGTDPQNSLLLRSNVPVAPSSLQVKQMPTPEGYLTPELLDSIAF